jgi:hypothetical protein
MPKSYFVLRRVLRRIRRARNRPAAAAVYNEVLVNGTSQVHAIA